MNFLKRKINNFYKVIDKAMNKYKKHYISCSWGKDSILVVHLIISKYPDTKVVFMNSGYALSDIYKFRNYYLKEYGIKNYIELKCPHDYAKLNIQYGLPSIDRSISDHEKVKNIIKKDVIEEWAVENNFDCCFWGIRADETAGRKKLLRRHGLLYKVSNIAKCSPIGWWSNEDVWNIIDYYGLPYSEIYNKEMKPFFIRNNIKNGGYLTTDKANQGRLIWLKKFYPDDYNKLSSMFEEVKRYV